MVTAAASSSPASAGELAGDEADDVGRAVSELQRLLLDTRGVEDFLQGMAALAARLLPAGLSCGVAIEAGGKSVTASCSDEIASQVDEVQYLLDEGPCPEALRHQRVVLADDTAGTTSWPDSRRRRRPTGSGRACACR
jgi:hypothetical protein